MTSRPELQPAVAQEGSDRGASAVEYGLIASLIAAVIAAIVATFGQETLALFQALDWP
jgi:Flp pilus assembly pilin Flp